MDRVLNLLVHLIFPESAWHQFRVAVTQSPADLVRLAREADEEQRQPAPTVMDKVVPGPSGDCHDYVSQAPYWWPDPDQPDGLPYLKRDGEVNPEFFGQDRDRLESLRARFLLNLLQAEAADDANARRRAASLLKTWFINPATRMNPHLRYAQRIPGRCEGRGIGIIDTAMLWSVLEGVGRLPTDENWTGEDQAGLRGWFSDYLDWLLTHEYGIKEGKEHNNHGTWYDVQVVSFALFANRPEIARRQLAEISVDRITRQVEPDGAQPHELSRTLSRSYTTFNLLGFVILAVLGRHVDIHLAGPETDYGRRLRAAARWLLPYHLGERAWTWPQITPYASGPEVLVFSILAEWTGEPDFAQARDRLCRHPWQTVSPWGMHTRAEEAGGAGGFQTV